MWKPKQLLHGRVIDALFQGGFSTLEIEFLGWLSYTAAALNNSRNPVLAAHTLLQKASEEGERLHEMLATFANRKRESITPTNVPEHAHADKVFAGLKEEINDSLIRAQMNSATYEDLSKGGISDGDGSITSQGYDENGELVPVSQEDDDDGTED